ncbi:MAG: hypothetical protein ACOYVD_01935 [Bacillota bacterium]
MRELNLNDFTNKIERKRSNIIKIILNKKNENPIKEQGKDPKMK